MFSVYLIGNGVSGRQMHPGGYWFTVKDPKVHSKFIKKTHGGTEKAGIPTSLSSLGLHEVKGRIVGFLFSIH